MMYIARDKRTVIGPIIAMTFFMFFLYSLPVQAQSTTLDASSCNTLYGLPAGTISTTASLQYLNPTVCAAYQDLISRYNPGPASQVGLSNAKVTGITSLNTTFALNLDNMLKAADAAGYHITINSAYRTIAGEVAANAKGFSGNPSASMHTKGLAADLQYPNDSNVTGECDGSASNLSAAYKWVFANDSTYHIGQYDQLHAHVSGECNHVEAIAGSTPGGLGPGGGNVSIGSVAGQTQLGAQSNITGTPGLGSNLQAYCSGSMIVYQDASGNMTIGQTCPSGCLNGMCIQQTCLSGYTQSNGLCMQNQTTTQAPAASTAATPASTASAAPLVSTPASTATTAPNPTSTITTTPTTVTQPSTVTSLTTATPSTLASPTIVTTLNSSSTQGLVQALANPVVITTSAATETPTNLNNGLDQVSQLSAPALPGVTYAQPASSLFAGSSGSGNGITTSGGSGYGTTGGSVSATGAGSTGTIAAGGTAAPSENSVSTFQSDDTSGTVTSAPTSSATAPTTTFASNALSILATLKAQLLGALNFLKGYLASAPSNASAQGSE